MPDFEGFPGLANPGVPGLPLGPGDHVCAFYRGLPERDEVLIPYLQEGLRSGEKCICVVDATDPEAVLHALGADHDLGPLPGTDQLDVRRSRDTYLRDGGFSITGMIDLWDVTINGALAGGFSFARAVGEMTWALRQMPGVEDLVRYESELNHFLPR